MSSVLIFPPSESEDMKLRQEDREWLAKEVANAASVAVQTEADKFKPHGLNRLAHFLQTWGLSAAAITAPLALLAMVITLGIFAAKELSDNSKFQQHTSDRLDAIEGDIRGLKAQASVESVSSSIRFAEATAAPPKPAEVKKLSDQIINALNQYPSVPVVWQTTGEFINYKFKALSPTNERPAAFMDCRNGGDMTINHGEITFSNCEIGLSDRLVGGRVTKLIFKHCIIDYKGGAVPSLPILFLDCQFKFDVPTVPPPRGGQTMRILAQAEDLNVVEIPG